MKILYISLGVCLLTCTDIRTCQTPEPVDNNLLSHIEMRPAIEADIDGIVALISQHGIHDNDKIVILPENFRHNAVKAAVAQGRIFVAYDRIANLIVGFKKLFLIDNPQERSDIAHHELRYAGDTAQRVNASTHTYANQACILSAQDCASIQTISDHQVIWIYNGGDFTHPSSAYRRKGINTALTQKAFESLHTQVVCRLKDASIKAIACVYGLTYHNDYNDTGNGTSRTPGLIRLFAQFISRFASTTTSVRICHERFKSYMPTFNLTSAECKPLPDDQAIKGYGNVLYHMLTPVNNHTTS